MGYLILLIYILLVIYAFIKASKKELIVFYDNGDMLFVLMTALCGTIIGTYMLSTDVVFLHVCALTLFIAFLIYNGYIVAMYNSGLGNIIVALIARITLSLIFGISLAEVYFEKNNERRRDHIFLYKTLAAISAVVVTALVHKKRFSNPFAYFKLERIKSIKQRLSNSRTQNLQEYEPHQ